MRLDVPFYPQTQRECGPVTLKMILEFFGDRHELEELAILAEQDAQGMTFTVGLAKAAAQLGFTVDYCSKTFELEVPPEAEAFHKEYTSASVNVIEKVRRLQEEYRELGGRCEERYVPTDELLGRIGEDAVAIVLIDWSQISHKPGFQGHFVVLAGYDEENVFLHQPGPRDATPFWPLPRKIFDQARAAPGTDGDIVLIHRKE